jgi:hypothetical protein
METACLSETSVTVYRTTPRQILAESSLHGHLSKNLRCYNSVITCANLCSNCTDTRDDRIHVFVPKRPTWFAKSNKKKVCNHNISASRSYVSNKTILPVGTSESTRVSECDADACVQSIRHINLNQNCFCKPHLILNTTAEKVDAKINRV